MAQSLLIKFLVTIRHFGILSLEKDPQNGPYFVVTWLRGGLVLKFVWHGCRISHIGLQRRVSCKYPA